MKPKILLSSFGKSAINIDAIWRIDGEVGSYRIQYGIENGVVSRASTKINIWLFESRLNKLVVGEAKWILKEYYSELESNKEYVRIGCSIYRLEDLREAIELVKANTSLRYELFYKFINLFR